MTATTEPTVEQLAAGYVRVRAETIAAWTTVARRTAGLGLGLLLVGTVWTNLDPHAAPLTAWAQTADPVAISSGFLAVLAAITGLMLAGLTHARLTVNRFLNGALPVWHRILAGLLFPAALATTVVTEPLLVFANTLLAAWVLSIFEPRTAKTGTPPTTAGAPPMTSLADVDLAPQRGHALLTRTPRHRHELTERQPDDLHELTEDIGRQSMPSPGKSVFSAQHLEVTTKTGVRLLDDVSITVPAGTLVGVIGPSGAGKSTLIDALTGLQPATRGQVTWNGRDLYAEYAQLRHLVGLVPQEDILHRQLTVRRALQFAAQLRLPPDMSPSERNDRVDQVLSQVDLTGQSDQRIDSLSGGQRKRTSIALELLTAPPLLFLDEPTSGLDPGLDRQVMETLRSLADADRVVMVATHSVQAVDQCDLVLVLARGGRVAFFGPPEDVLPFFGVDDYPAAFAALNDETGVDRYPRSPDLNTSTGSSAPIQGPGTPTVATAPRRHLPLPRSSPARQLWTLIQRNVVVVAADRLFVGLLIGMPIVLALMAQAFPGRAGLSLSEAQGDVNQIQQRLVVLVVGAALMGTALSVREMVVERQIYRRERAVGLSPAAYLLSKAAVLGVLVACQCALFTVLALLGLPGPDEALLLGNGRLEVAVAVAAVGVAMTIAALAVSGAVTSTEQTMPALVAMVMAQLILCGGLFPLAGRVGLEQVSWLLPARFGYAATAATVGLQQPGEPEVDPLFDPAAGQWLIDLGLLGILSLVFLGLTACTLHRSVTRNPWR